MNEPQSPSAPWSAYGVTIEAPRIEGALTFHHISLSPTEGTGLRDILTPEHLAGVVLAVGFVSDQGVEVIGSAVMVAPAIAMTANHNLADRLRAVMASDQIPHCLAVGSYGLELWDIKTISPVPDSDVALMGLIPRFKLPEDKRLFQMQMTTRFPRLGERVEVFGYRATEQAFPIDGASSTAVMHCYVSSGVVSAIYQGGRDRVMMPWPCFEVDCPTPGGMSGGPVCDESGHLIGLLSTSVGGEVSGPSYASMITRAFVTRFNSAWPTGFLEPQRCLMEINPLLRTIHGEDALTIVESREDGIVYRHSPWS